MAQPFARAMAMMAALTAAQTSGDLAAALSALGPYVSRGHGGRHPARTRQNFQPRSKYTPHQGKCECARRIRQDLIGQEVLRRALATR